MSLLPYLEGQEERQRPATGNCGSCVFWLPEISHMREYTGRGVCLRRSWREKREVLTHWSDGCGEHRPVRLVRRWLFDPKRNKVVVRYESL